MRTTLLLTVVACLALGGAGPAARTAVDPHSVVLSLADVPRGYRNGDDSGCGPFVPTGESNLSPALTALLLQTRPQGCVIELNRAWQDSSIGPSWIWSAAFVFADEDGARQLMASRGEAARIATEIRATKATPITLGDEAFLLEGQGLNYPAAAVIWRSGNTVAVLGTEPGDVARTRALAATQQALIARPATRPAVTEDVELELDDPSLHLPVYWLGRTFAPAGLPQLTLRNAEHLTPTGGPGDTVRIVYTPASRSVDGVTLDLWQPAAWKRFSKTLLGRLVWDTPCATKTTVELANGRADIYAGYATATIVRKPCPKAARNRLTAQVYLPGVVVVVDMPWCYMCMQPTGRARPYETTAAMKTIVRALTLR
jgi:hypothetical protein